MSERNAEKNEGGEEREIVARECEDPKGEYVQHFFEGERVRLSDDMSFKGMIVERDGKRNIGFIYGGTRSRWATDMEIPEAWSNEEALLMIDGILKEVGEFLEPD